MNRLSAHIGYLFSELPLGKRIQAAARAGFTAIEHPQPFAIPPAEMRGELEAHDLIFTQIAAAVGDPSRGEKGLAALPSREADFRDAFDRSLDYALAVGCRLIHPMAGVPPEGQAAAGRATYLRNLDHAIGKTASLPITVLIEPISHSAVPGYAMATIEDAVAAQDVFGPGNIRLLIDTFHASANGFDLLTWLPGNIDRIGHVHVADHPGRHEPGTGTIGFDDFLNALGAGYDGAIGFEYIPAQSTMEGLGFLPAWKEAQVRAATKINAGV